MEIFFFSRKRRHTKYWGDWSSDVCSSDLDPRRIHPCPPAKNSESGRILRVRRTPLHSRRNGRPSHRQSEDREDRGSGGQSRIRKASRRLSSTRTGQIESVRMTYM